MNAIAKTLLLVTVLFSGISHAGEAPLPVAAINSVEGIALRGYDAVAYFDQHAPTPGSEKYSTRWNGVEYRFISAEHRDRFIASPEHYAPQYGGYCSLAMSKNLIADGDPNAWAVVGDKLYLNNNKVAHTLWSLDKPGNIQLGNKNWPAFPKHGAAANE
jgi:YHS domain-containing protein